MKSHVSRHLSTLSADIASAQAELSRLRDRLEVQRAALDDFRVRMLIAETPLADRDLHAASVGYLRIEQEIRDAEQALAALREEERLLSEGLTTAGA
jgi:chromosome segregation ATPase